MRANACHGSSLEHSVFIQVTVYPIAVSFFSLVQGSITTISPPSKRPNPTQREIIVRQVRLAR